MNANQKMMAIAIRKSLLKETTQPGSSYSEGRGIDGTTWASASISKKRAVYMNDGDEFQIQLFNPERFQVGCLIYINGILMSQRKIVLRPGERIWLDRHIDTPDRLKFSTYEVGKSKAVQEAIKNNGLIKVDFYKEQEQHITIQQPSIVLQQPYNAYNYVCGMSDITCDSGVHSVNTAHTVLGACLDDNDIMGDIQASFCSAKACADANVEVKAYAATGVVDHSHKMETGRIEHGSHSDKSFQQASVDFEWFPYHTEEVQILPLSRKPVHANDLQKRFCPCCGRKTKDGFRFCPYCGKEL